MHNQIKTNVFWPKSQSWEVPFQVCSSGGPLATPKWPPKDLKMRKNTDFSWVFLANHKVLVALICITWWELMIFGQKSKVERSPLRFIALVYVGKTLSGIPWQHKPTVRGAFAKLQKQRHNVMIFCTIHTRKSKVNTKPGAYLRLLNCGC